MPAKLRGQGEGCGRPLPELRRPRHPRLHVKRAKDETCRASVLFLWAEPEPTGSGAANTGQRDARLADGDTGFAARSTITLPARTRLLGRQLRCAVTLGVCEVLRPSSSSARSWPATTSTSTGHSTRRPSGRAITQPRIGEDHPPPSTH